MDKKAKAEAKRARKLRLKEGEEPEEEVVDQRPNLNMPGAVEPGEEE